MTLALIAGRGGLPGAVARAQAVPPQVFALEGFTPERLIPDGHFRIEHLGSFIAQLSALGVTEVCLCGGIDRPQIDPAQIDAATLPLVPMMMQALGQGDDGALRAVIAVFEEKGVRVRAAHDLAPDLLPPAGTLTQAEPDMAGLAADLRLADKTLAQMGAEDLGQACVLRGGVVIAREDISGTDEMLAGVAQPGAGGFLFKAPKPGQDRRADLPTIGPYTARAAQVAGLDGIVIEAGGVIMLERAQVVEILDAAGLYLWVRAP